MARVEETIEVNVPLRTAYNQWTQFEEFPKFMEGVKSVRQLDDRTLEWNAEIAGDEEKWTAEITEQEPDQRIAWRSISGIQTNGLVTFARAGEGATRVTLAMEWQPKGMVQAAGDRLGFDDRRVKGDLERFKEFIESRGAETGAWRGEIEQGSPTSR
jgi:uncharacterized membrane protein